MTVNSNDQMPAKNKLDLEQLRRDIERQTGFPSELKVAEILLRRGWSYKGNPRFRRKSTGEIEQMTEVDFIAHSNCPAPGLCEELGKAGHFCINLVIDVKHFFRPLIVFTSPVSDRDSLSTYMEIHQVSGHERIRSQFNFSNIFRKFKQDEIGRIAVVANLEQSRPPPKVPAGNKPSQAGAPESSATVKIGDGKKFDHHQISSALSGLYDACRALREEILEDRRLNRHEGASRWIEVILPMIVYDGDVLSYSSTNGTSSLQPVDLAMIGNNFIGSEDPLLSSLAMIVQLNEFDLFLKELEDFTKDLNIDIFDFSRGHHSTLR